MPDDPAKLREQGAHRRQTAEKSQASADVLIRKARILQASADAENRAALALEARARAAEQEHQSAARRKWGGMVIVSAPPLGPETAQDALRSADVEDVERQALEAGIARGFKRGIEQTKQQQHARFSGARKNVGATTQAKVDKVWQEESERLEAQYGANVPQKTIEAAVAERVGKSPRTVQRCLQKPRKFRHKV